MAATLHPSPVPTPSASTPPTPPYSSFPRLPTVSRNASTSSSTSVSSTTSSLVAAPIRPPPAETRTAATTSPRVVSRSPSAEPQSEDASIGAQSPRSERGGYVGRGFNIRNGPRSRGPTLSRPTTPAIITCPPPSVDLPGRSTPERNSVAGLVSGELSPTTPRGPNRWNNGSTSSASPSPVPGPSSRAGQGPLRVTVSMDPMDSAGLSQPQFPVGLGRGRAGQWSTPSSPIERTSPGRQMRTLSVDRREAAAEEARERRQSQASAHSSTSASAPRKPSIRDFVLGEELGRGSYSTVVQAVSARNAPSSTSSPRPPREYAIKIINQAHLIAEKKAKYAVIERDALIRLATPSTPHRAGHRRGLSSSSSTGMTSSTSKQNTSTSLNGISTASSRRDIPTGGAAKDRLSVATDGSSSSGSTPLSPILHSKSLAGRRPSRSAEPPEMVPERSEESVLDTVPSAGPSAMRSRPPSPVREESHTGTTPPTEAVPEYLVEQRTGVSIKGTSNSPTSSTAPPTPDLSNVSGGGGVTATERKQQQRKRRESVAQSERSMRSTKSGKSQAVAHPGIIRLHSTFNDQTSLYFVLDLAKNGEFLTWLRKYGSLNTDSARYYAAQLVDTIEFMHERGVIHRDLKPENVLLDDDMRIKVTDFGSAKLLNRDGEPQDNGNGKRSFVGSADFVSPEVLRNEPAGLASDIWAFGCMLYQFLVGKPPFRGATDYLTFQKILKRDMEYPEEMDPDARSLIDLLLDLDPVCRPLPVSIKNHAFFAAVDFSSIWQVPAVPLATGLNGPIHSSANPSESDDIWAVFDDEVSDGGFEYDDDEAASPMEQPLDAASRPNNFPRRKSTKKKGQSSSAHFNGLMAAEAVQSVDGNINDGSGSHNRQNSSGSLEPPKAAYMDAGKAGRRSRWSSGTRSARTSSSSSGGNRTALTGLLETIGIHASGTSTGTPSQGNGTAGYGNSPRGSNRDSRTSDRSDETRGISRTGTPLNQEARWASVLLANEKVVYTSPITVRPTPTGASSLIPSFLLPSSTKRRQLVLTDFPRLIEVKDEEGGSANFRIKFEAILNRKSNGENVTDLNDSRVDTSGTAGKNRLVEVQEKGSRGFLIFSGGGSMLYVADTVEARAEWMAAIKRAST